MQIVDKYGRPRELDDDAILPDGATMKVPMTFMDSVLQQRVARATARASKRALVTDAFGDSDDFAMARPGFRYPTRRTTADVNKQLALDEAKEHAENAWKTQPPTPPPIQPVISNRSEDTQPPLVEDREAVLREVEDRDNNAWRNGK